MRRDVSVASRSARRLAAGALCLLLLLVVVACGGPVSRPVDLGRAERLAANGKFEEARRLLQQVDLKFAGRAGMAPMLERSRAHLLGFEKAFKRVEQELLGRLSSDSAARVMSYARGAARRADVAGHGYDAAAYRALLGKVLELRKLAAHTPAPAAPEQPRSSRKPERAKVESRVSTGDEAAMLGAVFEHALEDLDRLTGAHEFGQALTLLRQIPASDANADRLRAERWKVEAAAKAYIDDTLVQSAALEKAGQLGKAYRWLRARSEFLPRIGSLSVLTVQAKRVHDLMRAGPSIGRGGPAVVADVEDAIRASGGDPAGDSGFKRRVRRELAAAAAKAFAERDYKEAAVNYRKAADLSRGLHFEGQYRARAAQARLLFAALRSVSSAIRRNKAAFRRVDLGYGEKADLLSADRDGVLARIGKKTEKVLYDALPDAALARVLARAAQTGSEFLGAAVLYSQADKPDLAVELLKKAIVADSTIKPSVDELLARIRRESPGDGGYQLIDGKFVSARAMASAEIAKRVKKRLPAIYGATSNERRDAVYKKILADDSRALSIVADAFVAKKRKIREHITASKTGRKLDKLRELRVELDKRRAHAHELIFDTVRYFYPYRPPAVSGKKALEYAPVQREVDARVAAVREIWDATQKHPFRLSKGTCRELDLYRWLTRRLGSLGVVTHEMDREFRVLLAEDSMNIRNVALDAEDRKSLHASTVVLAKNAKRFAKLLEEKAITPEEVELHRLTNQYRLMMGVPALGVDVRLVRAAHGHCEEMTRLGYFGHFSPTPGRKSPADRMRKEGYLRGGGENLAQNMSPAGAIYAWQHSSGHHRNMLYATHKDLGTGYHGRNFAQNFGSGAR